MNELMNAWMHDWLNEWVSDLWYSDVPVHLRGLCGDHMPRRITCYSAQLVHEVHLNIEQLAILINKSYVKLITNFSLNTLIETTLSRKFNHSIFVTYLLGWRGSISSAVDHWLTLCEVQGLRSRRLMALRISCCVAL